MQSNHLHSASDIRAAAPGGAGAGTPRRFFWQRDQEASLGRRIAAINRINDPTIKTDNVLMWTRRVIYLLLAITAVIGGLNYWKFFGMSIQQVSIVAFLTVAVTVAVEFGKYYCVTEALRTAFFRGWGYIFGEVHTAVIWVGLALIGVLTLGLSAYNSTRGAEQLAYLVSHESAKGQAVFTPNTTDIDQQIQAARANQATHNANKWKGTIVWASAQASTAEAKNITALLAQKEEVIAQQRVDWERQQAERRQHTEHAAGYILKIGGWIELLQFILMFVRVACEKQLSSHPDAQPSPTSARPYHFNGAPHAAHASNYKPAGFKTGPDGNYIPAHPTDVGPPPMSQAGPPVTQVFSYEIPSGIQPDEMLRWYESELRREPPNLRDKWAKKETVLNRIHKKIALAHSAIDRCKPGVFSPAAAARFAAYLTENMQPLLIEWNSAYAGLHDLVASLRHKTATEGEAVIQ